MKTEKYIFCQLTELLSHKKFQRCVKKYEGDYRVRSFSSWDHFLCMLFAQLTNRESLRDIESTLRAVGVDTYHLGIRGRVSRSTLSDANEKRDWRIFAEFGNFLMEEAKQLYSDDNLVIEELSQAVYAMDSTNIELCLSLFPWAQFDQERAGIRVDALLNVHTSLPCLIDVSTRKTTELTAMDSVTICPGSIYVFDRGYFDWHRLYRFSHSLAYFVIRAKKGLKYKRQLSLSVKDKSAGIRSDQIILPHSKYARKNYPQVLRRISYVDISNNQRLVFLTNNRTLKPETIADLYRSRWKIELFFKWIKQNLRIKSFYGTSFNAVKIQIWIALSAYLILAIAKKKLNLDISLYTFSQTISVIILQKTPLFHAFSAINQKNIQIINPIPSYQLDLFDF